MKSLKFIIAGMLIVALTSFILIVGIAVKSTNIDSKNVNSEGYQDSQLSVLQDNPEDIAPIATENTRKAGSQEAKTSAKASQGESLPSQTPQTNNPSDILLSPASQNAEGFVYANGTEFYLNSKPFYFSGANNYYLRYADIYCIAYDKNGGCSREVLDDAQQMNLSVVRTWGFTDGDYYWGSMQPSLGVYDELNFKKLDYIIKEASERDIKLIIPFVNNWPEYGGMCQYARWCNITNASLCDPYAKTGSKAIVHDSFYTNSCTRQSYKDYIDYMLNRANSYTGIKYKDDPTIFAWELANEPRAMSNPAVLDDWIEEMGAFVKSLDENHMLTTGEEGFYNGKGAGELYNGSMGNDFIANHNHSSIDFATFHLYPDYWGLNLAASVNWISEHANDSRSILGKPVILEEFNKQGAQKDNYMQAWYDAIKTSNVNGNLFWELIDHNYPWDPDFGINYPENASTVGIISNSTEYLIGFNKQNSPSNNAPSINPINNLAVTEGDIVAINISASDLDEDYLFYSISDAYHFNRINNQFAWNTHAGDRGNYTVTLSASDGIDKSSTTFNLEILENNNCVVPFNKMIANIDMTLCPGSYHLPDGIQLASDVVLDCNGAEIYGNNTEWGITTSGENSVIKNCKIKKYKMGIQLLGAYGITIINNTFSSYLYHGINIRESNGINITGNNFTYNSDIGTYCYHSSGNYISKNRFVTNGKGIYFDVCSKTEINENYFYRNNGGAVHLLGLSNNNTLSKNNMVENGISWSQGGGVIIQGKDNTIIKNNISGNYNGITMSNNPNNISFNNIWQNAYYDIFNSLQNNSVTPNWFGTTNCIAIQDKIYDCHDNPSYGCLNFEPILNAPYPGGHAIMCGIACSMNSDCGDNGWVDGLLCKEGNIWGTYREYTCHNNSTISSYCSYEDNDMIKKECKYGCEQGVCTDIKFTCSSNAECGTDGFIGSLFCAMGNVLQQYRTWTCNNPATISSYCSYNDTKQITEVCNGSCLDGKCTPPMCSIDSDCGNNSWIGIPYCQGNEVWQNYRTYNCILGTCSYSDSPKAKENCTSCSNGVCSTTNATADLELLGFFVQSKNLTAGKDIYLAFTIKNTGKIALNNIEWKLETNSSGAIDGIVSELLLGNARIIVKKVVYPNPGTYYPKATVDPSNKIIEFNEANNRGEINLTIL